MPDDPSPSDTLDSVLKKYGKIWIWSILAAAVAALSARFVGVASLQYSSLISPGRPQIAVSFFFFTIAFIVPAAATLVSVWYLLLFLKHHVVPILFPPTPPTEPGVYADTAIGPPPDGARLLVRAFAAVVVVIASEVATGIIALIYRLAA